MRIWIIEIGESLPGIDGNERDWRCGMLSKALVAQGHEVIWWASTFFHARKTHRFNSPHVIETLPGLQIRFLHGPGYVQNRSPNRILHHRIVAHAFAHEATRSAKPHVIFCCLPTLELADRAVKYGRKMGVPVLIDVRDLWPEHYLTLVPSWLRGALRVALFAEFQRVRNLLGHATGITAISNSFLEWGLRYAGREARKTDGVFPMGYPGEVNSTQIRERQEALASQYALSPDDFVVTFVGTFASSFDLETVVRAARILARSDKRIRFMFVGDGDGGHILRDQAADLTNVVFTGWFDQISIRAILNLSSVGLAPYKDDASMSLPNKPFEYMSAGLPLLSSLRGELEHLICNKQIGMQYQSGDVNSLIEKIQLLEMNPYARHAMGTCARKLFDDAYKAELIYPTMVDHLVKVAGEFSA